MAYCIIFHCNVIIYINYVGCILVINIYVSNGGWWPRRTLVHASQIIRIATMRRTKLECEEWNQDAKNKARIRWTTLGWTLNGTALRILASHPSFVLRILALRNFRRVHECSLLLGHHTRLRKVAKWLQESRCRNSDARSPRCGRVAYGNGRLLTQLVEQRFGRGVRFGRVARPPHVRAARLAGDGVDLGRVHLVADTDRVQLDAVLPRQARLAARQLTLHVRVPVGEYHADVGHAGTVAARRPIHLLTEQPQRRRRVRSAADAAEAQRVEDLALAAVAVQREVDLRRVRIGDERNARAVELDREAVHQTMDERQRDGRQAVDAAGQVEHDAHVHLVGAACSGQRAVFICLPLPPKCILINCVINNSTTPIVSRLTSVLQVRSCLSYSLR